MSVNSQRKLGLRERKKAKTMAAVQMHAMRLFQEYGYQATTVEQITEAAEISPSTFFRYFRTKEDVMTMDNYDPLLISAFEAQPMHLSPIQAMRSAMLTGLADMSVEEVAITGERIQMIMKVPELRAAAMNNLTQTMQMIKEMIAKRSGRKPEDMAVLTMAGAIIGVNISVMMHYAEHPEENFADLMGAALSKLEESIRLE